MKKIYFFSIALFSVFLITSVSVKPSESQRLFEKIILVEISLTEDSMLFKPYSKAWGELWERSANISIYGSPLMNYDKYKFSFNGRTDNLYTILHPLIIDGTIKSYWPYNPENYGFRPWDDGELRYPIVGQDKNETFFTSETVRENLCYLLGKFGPQYDVPLVDEFGENIIITLEDGTQSFQYESPDFYWYEDKDITKFKLRVSILVNKNGKEKKRIIKSISPMVARTTDSGSILGYQELLWLNFEEVEPYLENAYFVDDNLKPVSYLDHIRQKVETTTLK